MAGILRRIESVDRKLTNIGKSYGITIPTNILRWISREWGFEDLEQMQFRLVFVRDHNEVANNEKSFLILLPYDRILTINDYGPIIKHLVEEAKRGEENNKKGLKKILRKLWDYYLITWGEEDET